MKHQLTILLVLFIQFFSINNFLTNKPILDNVSSGIKGDTIMPGYPGGIVALNGFVVNHVNVPPLVVELGLEGSLKAEFIVDYRGRVGSINILYDSVGFGMSEEIVRVLGLMADRAKWTPGKVNGKTVSVKFIYPFIIRSESPVMPDSNLEPNPDIKPKLLIKEKLLVSKILRGLDINKSKKAIRKNMGATVHIAVDEDGRIHSSDLYRSSYSYKINEIIRDNLGVIEDILWSPGIKNGKPKITFYSIRIEDVELKELSGKVYPD